MVFVLGTGMAQAGDDAARLELARKIVQSDNGGKMPGQMLEMMKHQFAATMLSHNPGRKAEIQQLMSETFGEVDKRKDEMTSRVVALYAEKYTLEELRQMIAFRQSPLGKKMDKVMPEIARQSMMFGQKWGQKVSQEVMQRLREKAQKRGLKL